MKRIISILIIVSVAFPVYPVSSNPEVEYLGTYREKLEFHYKYNFFTHILAAKVSEGPETNKLLMRGPYMALPHVDFYTYLTNKPWNNGVYGAKPDHEVDFLRNDLFKSYIHGEKSPIHDMGTLYDTAYNGFMQDHYYIPMDPNVLRKMKKPLFRYTEVKKVGVIDGASSYYPKRAYTDRGTITNYRVNDRYFMLPDSWSIGHADKFPLEYRIWADTGKRKMIEYIQEGPGDSKLLKKPEWKPQSEDDLYIGMIDDDLMYDFTTENPFAYEEKNLGGPIKRRPLRLKSHNPDGVILYVYDAERYRKSLPAWNLHDRLLYGYVDNQKFNDYNPTASKYMYPKSKKRDGTRDDPIFTPVENMARMTYPAIIKDRNDKMLRALRVDIFTRTYLAKVRMGRMMYPGPAYDHDHKAASDWLNEGINEFTKDKKPLPERTALWYNYFPVYLYDKNKKPGGDTLVHIENPFTSVSITSLSSLSYGSHYLQVMDINDYWEFVDKYGSSSSYEIYHKNKQEAHDEMADFFVKWCGFIAEDTSSIKHIKGYKSFMETHNSDRLEAHFDINDWVIDKNYTKFFNKTKIHDDSYLKSPFVNPVRKYEAALRHIEVTNLIKDEYWKMIFATPFNRPGMVEKAWDTYYPYKNVGVNIGIWSGSQGYGRFRHRNDLSMKSLFPFFEGPDKPGKMVDKKIGGNVGGVSKFNYLLQEWFTAVNFVFPGYTKEETKNFKIAHGYYPQITQNMNTGGLIYGGYIPEDDVEDIMDRADGDTDKGGRMIFDGPFMIISSKTYKRYGHKYFEKLAGHKLIYADATAGLLDSASRIDLACAPEYINQMVDMDYFYFKNNESERLGHATMKPADEIKIAAWRYKEKPLYSKHRPSLPIEKKYKDVIEIICDYITLGSVRSLLTQPKENDYPDYVNKRIDPSRTIDYKLEKITYVPQYFKDMKRIKERGFYKPYEEMAGQNGIPRIWDEKADPIWHNGCGLRKDHWKEYIATFVIPKEYKSQYGGNVRSLDENHPVFKNIDRIFAFYEELNTILKMGKPYLTSFNGYVITGTGKPMSASPSMIDYLEGSTGDNKWLRSYITAYPSVSEMYTRDGYLRKRYYMMSEAGGSGNEDGLRLSKDEKSQYYHYWRMPAFGSAYQFANRTLAPWEWEKSMKFDFIEEQNSLLCYHEYWKQKATGSGKYVLQTPMFADQFQLGQIWARYRADRQMYNSDGNALGIRDLSKADYDIYMDNMDELVYLYCRVTGAKQIPAYALLTGRMYFGDVSMLEPEYPKVDMFLEPEYHVFEPNVMTRAYLNYKYYKSESRMEEEVGGLPTDGWEFINARGLDTTVMRKIQMADHIRSPKYIYGFDYGNYVLSITYKVSREDHDYNLTHVKDAEWSSFGESFDSKRKIGMRQVELRQKTKVDDFHFKGRDNVQHYQNGDTLELLKYN